MRPDHGCMRTMKHLRKGQNGASTFVSWFFACQNNWPIDDFLVKMNL
jgi:hypothetical protein